MDIKLFLKILQSELWQTPLSLPAISRSDGDELFDFAEDQAVIGLFSNALVHNSIHIGDDNAMRAVASIRLVCRKNEEMNVDFCKCIAFLRRRNLSFLIVKGQTLASLYPNPLHRNPGDVDIFCGLTGFVPIRDAFLCNNDGSQDTSIPVKHQEVTVNGIEYELHRVLAIFGPSRYQRKFDEIMEKAKTEPDTIYIGNATVPVLSPTYNAFYQTVHIYHHIIKEGIGLRQLCDFAIYLHRYHAEIDDEKLHRMLAFFHYNHVFCAIGSILVDYLGLPAAEFHGTISDKDKKWAKKIEADIIRGGNFGKLCHDGKYKRKWKILSHYLKYLPLTPYEISFIIPERLMRPLRGLKS